MESVLANPAFSEIILILRRQPIRGVSLSKIRSKICVLTKIFSGVGGKQDEVGDLKRATPGEFPAGKDIVDVTKSFSVHG